MVQTPLRMMVAGDKSSAGKSTISLGLLVALLDAGFLPHEVAYIKPATQCVTSTLVARFCEEQGIAWPTPAKHVGGAEVRVAIPVLGIKHCKLRPWKALGGIARELVVRLRRATGHGIISPWEAFAEAAPELQHAERPAGAACPRPAGGVLASRLTSLVQVIRLWLARRGGGGALPAEQGHGVLQPPRLERRRHVRQEGV